MIKAFYVELKDRNNGELPTFTGPYLYFGESPLHSCQTPARVTFTLPRVWVLIYVQE